MGVLCSTHSLLLDMIVHLLQTHQEKSVRRLSMLEDSHYETSSFWIFRVFFSFFTGRVLSLKLIRLNRHDDRFCRSQLEACFFFKQKHQNCVQAARASKVITSSHPRAFHAPENGGYGKFQSVILYRPLLSGHKKKYLRKRTIFCGKNLFSKS